MEPTALKRLKRVAGKQTTTLTHYGRKTGKPHEVTIWFVLDDDKIYIGARDDLRRDGSGGRAGCWAGLGVARAWRLGSRGARRDQEGSAGLLRARTRWRWCDS